MANALVNLAKIFCVLAALFVMVVALLNIIALGDSRVIFSANFPSCGSFDSCVQPGFNQTWSLGVLSAVTFLFGALLFLHGIRDHAKTNFTAAFEGKEFFIFTVIGFMVMGQAAVLGFSAAIVCFFTAILYFLVLISERNGGFSRL